MRTIGPIAGLEGFSVPWISRTSTREVAAIIEGAFSTSNAAYGPDVARSDPVRGETPLNAMRLSCAVASVPAVTRIAA